MKYVRTFENFNNQDINEGLLWGEGSIWQKIGSWVSSWKNKEMAKGAQAFTSWSEENSEKMEEMKSRVSSELKNLSEEDIKELSSKLERFSGSEPSGDVIEAASRLARVEEKMSKMRTGSKIYESYTSILEKSEEDLSRKLTSFLGLGMKFSGILSIVCSMASYFYTTLSGVETVNPLFIVGAVIAGMTLIIGSSAINYKLTGR